MLQGLTNKHLRDYTDAVHASGQTVTFLEATGPRAVKVRVKMLSAEELANCMEQYTCRLHVANEDFPGPPPVKGMIVEINGVRRAVLAVRGAMPNDIKFGWLLECK